MEKITERTGIYHEHQQGALCAQHALNNLLQSQMFLADSLADIARELDVEEKSVLAHASHESENMDDTGFFNIQVLQRALRMFEIELVPFGSQEPIAQQARSRPDSIQAYICNLGLHWFTIRRFARQYFNLNSFYYVPEFVQLQILPHYLNLIKENGYSVFIVHGTLPACLADEQLRENPITGQEYELLTKDLPKLIMDGEVMGGPNDLSKNGDLRVYVSPDIYKQFQKNPNDPKLRQMILAQLPKDVFEADIPEHGICTNPHHHHHHHHHQQGRRKILIALIPEGRTEKQLIPAHNGPDYHQQHPVVSEHFEEELFENTNIDKPNESQNRPRMITRQVTQTMISPNFDDPNTVLVRQQTFTRTAVYMPERRDNTLIDEHNIPKMTQSSHNIENEEDLLLQEVMARSLLGESEMNVETSTSLFKHQTEQLYQQMLDIVIADSLRTNELEKLRIEQTPEIIPVTTTNSEPITIKMPSSLSSLPSTTTTTDAHSPPSTSIHSPSPNASLSAPLNTSLSPPTNTLLPPLTNTSIVPPTNTSLPPSTTTTNSTLPPPPTLTHSDSVDSPTVEELRQRRLKASGNRHRSIISTQSNFDD